MKTIKSHKMINIIIKRIKKIKKKKRIKNTQQKMDVINIM